MNWLFTSHHSEKRLVKVTKYLKRSAQVEWGRFHFVWKEFWYLTLAHNWATFQENWNFDISEFHLATRRYHVTVHRDHAVLSDRLGFNIDHMVVKTMIFFSNVLITNGNTELWPVSLSLDSFKIRKYKYYEINKRFKFPDQRTTSRRTRPRNPVSDKMSLSY